MDGVTCGFVSVDGVAGCLVWSAMAAFCTQCGRQPILGAGLNDVMVCGAGIA